MDARADIRDLLDAARRGAPDAIGRLFEAARGQLLQLAARELPPDVRAKVAASDIVQETAVDVHRGFGQFSGTTPEELFAWLREILRHNVVDAVRRFHDAHKRDANREVSLASEAMRHAGETLAGASHSPDGSAIRREEAATINVVLGRLPPDYRRVIQLRYWNGMSFVDIAPQLGRSPDAVRKLWYRALERLQSEMAALHTHAAAAGPGPVVVAAGRFRRRPLQCGGRATHRWLPGCAARVPLRTAPPAGLSLNRPARGRRRLTPCERHPTAATNR